MTKSRLYGKKIPSKYFLRVGMVLSLFCMLFIVGTPSAFAHSDSDGKVKSVSVKKDKKKQSSRYLRVFVRGGGKIVSSPPGLMCKGRICRGRFPKGSKVVLEAMSASGKVFSGWRGACGGSKKCTVRLNRHKNVLAVFSKPRLMRLAVKIRGDGKVQSDPPRLSCRRGYCTGRFPVGTTVMLLPQAGAGKSFSGWRGACKGLGACRVTLKRHKFVGAIFKAQRPSELISLEARIIGEGSIGSQPSGLSCMPGVCIGKFPAGMEVKLTVVPKTGYEFSGWGGACSGMLACQMTMDTPKVVTATFSLTPSPPPVVLFVTTEGEGRVTSDPIGVDCPGMQCVHEFENGQAVTLLAEPKAGHMFVGWSGACTGTEKCTVTLSSPMAVKAAFSLIPLPPVALSVTIVGDGQVTSTPAGIACSRSTCVHNYDNGQMVILVAAANTGQTFSGWSGDCTGTGSCQLGMTSPMAVTAMFVSGNPGMTDQAAKRFLEQATWGPTPELIAYVKSIGKDAFLDEQFAMNVSTYPDPTATPDSSSLTPARNQFFYNAFHLDDQLRQRVAFALGQLLVVSATKVGSDFQMIPYVQMLHDRAFGNYEDLMHAVTVSPTMGRYLDMVNNNKTEPGSGLNPNENYPREFLQLFSVGTTLLNSDGSDQVDPNGSPIPPYDQDVILNLSRVMTGWTYPTKPGETPRWRNPSYYGGPMEPFDSHHDMEEKILMNGFILPAGQTAVEDLNAAIHHVFQHPNVGPFVAVRLIRHLVTSNPSPQYIARVAQVFNANENGLRGDLRAVLKAILLDPEAASVLPQGGHLREPILFEVALLRALGATVDPVNPLYSRARDMGQPLFAAPHVFNYFSPLYHIGGTTSTEPRRFGPEFQIHNFSSSIARANFVDRVVRSSLGTGATVDLSSLEALADSPTQLVSAVSRMLLHELLRPQEHQSIVTAISASSNPITRVRTAVYLVATSSRYQVQH